MFAQATLLNLSARFLDLKVKNNFFSLVRINTITVGKLSHYKLPIVKLSTFLGFPCGSADKESACNVGDLGLIPGREDPLEEGMATHSSISAWRLLWTEELQFMGSQRVRLD